MTITVTFKDLDELFATLKVTREDILAATVGYEKPKKAAPEAKVETKKKAEPAPAEPAPEPAEDAPQVDESYRLELRKVLSDLNKKVGGNKARELILAYNDTGKLTDVALADLPLLMAKAQEALDA